MLKSESIKNLSKALTTFHLKVDKIKKDAKNPFFKSSYASLSNILDAINEPLIECGLTISQFPTGENGLTTILMHESGEFISAEYQMRPVKDDPQGRGSAITYQRRYAIASVLSLNIDDDDDANLATHGKKQPAELPKLVNREDIDKVKDYLSKGGSIAKVKEKYTIPANIEPELLTVMSNKIK